MYYQPYNNKKIWARAKRPKQQANLQSPCAAYAVRVNGSQLVYASTGASANARLCTGWLATIVIYLHVWVEIELQEW